VLARLWPDQDEAVLLQRYHEIEPTVESGSSTAYREVMASALERLAERQGLDLRPLDRDALGDALPSWPPFPEVPSALAELRTRGWRTGILSNTDPDLLGASIALLGVQPDVVITVAEAGSYKPAHGHWLAFRERTGADRSRHVHVGASLFHDIAPAAELGLPAVWINRLGERSELPRAAELADLAPLPDTLDGLVARG
jgi:2-haloacid dehalogenase